MAGTDEVALVMAAREGDIRARNALVGAYLPLVYNVVGRALNGHADVDDVVQETLIRALDGLPGLREVERFRSWIVTIAVNEVRRHCARRAADPLPDGDPRAEERRPSHADPGADFVDLALTQLELDDQRREAVAATRWLEADDRTVLSLWWLEAAGQLTRPEVAAALHLDPQHTAVVVQRAKAQLESARVVVRALAALPRCPALEGILSTWDGRPSALWRKRVVRHSRDCARCAVHRGALMPAEGLLAGFALVVPVALTALRSGGCEAGSSAGAAYAATAPGAAGAHAATASHAEAGGAADTAGVTTLGRRPGPRSTARLRRVRRRRRAVAAGAAACVLMGGAVVGGGLLDRERGESSSGTVAAAPTSASPAPESAPSSTSPSASSSPSSKAPERSADTPPSRTRTTSPSPTPTPSPSKTTPPSGSPRSAPPSSPPAAWPVQEVISLTNSERAKAGCGPVSGNDRLHSAALKHSQDMANRGYFDHRSPDGNGPGERITAAGYRWTAYAENIASGQPTAKSVVDAWMNSPGHRANIENCALKEIGVGVHRGGPHGILWTQKFGTR